MICYSFFPENWGCWPKGWWFWFPKFSKLPKSDGICGRSKFSFALCFLICFCLFCDLLARLLFVMTSLYRLLVSRPLPIGWFKSILFSMYEISFLMAGSLHFYSVFSSGRCWSENYSTNWFILSFSTYGLPFLQDEYDDVYSSSSSYGGSVIPSSVFLAKFVLIVV